MIHPLMNTGAPTTPSATDEQMNEWFTVDKGRTERIVRLFTEPVWDYVFRLRTYGVEHIPQTGSFLFCPNHSSWLDPFLQVRGQDRMIRFMAKAQVFEWPVVGKIVRSGGAFPVRRGQGDEFAIDLARQFLLDGQPVAIWPEGTRYRDKDELGPPRSGAARLAVQTGSRVIPVATYGAKPRGARTVQESKLALPKATTIYGPPLDFSDLPNDPEIVAQARDIIWSEVDRLYALAKKLHSLPTRPKTFEIPDRKSDPVAPLREKVAGH
jgi:1-acyl-sn-glycerol-3-phosphate acyltransferase